MITQKVVLNVKRNNVLYKIVNIVMKMIIVTSVNMMMLIKFNSNYYKQQVDKFVLLTVQQVSKIIMVIVNNNVQIIFVLIVMNKIQLFVINVMKVLINYNH